MITKCINQNGVKIAVIQSGEGETIISDVQSALDLMATVRYEIDCDRISISKSAVKEDFFILSTGTAGEILQKFVTYHVKLAIIGDYSGYTSKPLQDFIYESNKGSHIFFVNSEEEAITKLAGVSDECYTLSQLEDAKGVIQSSIRKIEKVLETLSKKDLPPKSQITLAKRNLKALRLALSLIEREMVENAD